MARLYPDKKGRGFTILESMVVLLIVSVLCGSLGAVSNVSLSAFGRNLLREIEAQQHLALAKRSRKSVEIENRQMRTEEKQSIFPSGISCEPISFSFNEKGNISKGGTVNCQKGSKKVRIVFQIGTGKGRIDYD